MTRLWPIPTDPERTLHLVGDTHCGSNGIPSSRLALVTNDLHADLGKTLIAPKHRFFLGDCGNNGISSEDATFQTFADGLETNDGVPWHAVCGNHDIFEDVRAPATWAEQYGYPSQNYTVDLGWALAVIVGPDSMQYAGTGNFAVIMLSTNTLAWMKAQHDAYSGPVLVFCHAPLFGTVGDDGSGQVNNSSDANVYVRNQLADSSSAAVTAVLGQMPRLKAWISGHSHSPLDSTNLVMQYTTGDAKFAHINTSCLWYTHKTGYSFDGPICSLYMTYLDGKIECRFRNHGNGVWVTASQKTLQTVAL